MQFFSLSLKPNVLGVWLAKGGRKMVEKNKNSTNHNVLGVWLAKGGRKMVENNKNSTNHPLN